MWKNIYYKFVLIKKKIYIYKTTISTSNSVWSDWLEQDWHIQQSQSLSQFDSDENPGSTVTSTKKE